MFFCLCRLQKGVVCYLVHDRGLLNPNTNKMRTHCSFVHFFSWNKNGHVSTILSAFQSKHIGISLWSPYRSNPCASTCSQTCVMYAYEVMFNVKCLSMLHPPLLLHPPSLPPGCRECGGAVRAGSVLQQTPCLFSLTFLRCSPNR